MKRLFIAVNLPEAIKWQIDALLAEFEGGFDLGAIRWIPKENWHITVVFLGDQPEENIPIIERSISMVIPDALRDKIFFREIGFGPSEEERRMIWLKLREESSGILAPLKAKLEKELREAGIALREERRLFSGHITLARFRDGTRPPLVAFPEVQNVFFEVDSLDLMESQLMPSGPKYSILSSFPFKKG